MLKSLGLLIVFLPLTIVTVAQINIKAFNNYLTGLYDNNEVNGSVLVGENGNILYKKSFGYADFSNNTPNSDSSLINIASISKTFTAIAILQLKEKGKLNLDDTYSKYFKQFPYPKISLRQLLSHTSGLPDMEPLFDSLIAKNPDKVFTIEDIIPALVIYSKSKPLRFESGERWGYSNPGYGLLALLVEKLSKQPFAIYMKKNIFLPAGMTHTYVQTSLLQKQDKNRVKNYMYANHFTMQLEEMDTLAYMKEWTYNLMGLTGSTNVISSLQDLWQYDKALYEGKLLRPSTLEEAYTPVKLNSGKPNIAAEGSYGLGWFIRVDSFGNKIVSHSGAAPGVLTFLIRNLTKKQTLIILQNIQNASFDINTIIALINGQPIIYKKSAAFAYAKDLYEKGADYAASKLLENKMDSAHYSLTEKDMSRVGLEFGRTRSYQNYSLEAYKINALLFPNSWRAYDDYAGALLKNNQTAAAEIMYRKSVSLNPDNQKAISFLKQIVEKKKYKACTGFNAISEYYYNYAMTIITE